VNLSVTLRPSADPERVRVTVFDALGRQVGVPVSGRRIEQSQSLSLSAQQMGTRAAGVYFLRIEGDSFTETIQVSHVE
jgi:SOS-response transcriptional repressor LexA